MKYCYLNVYIFHVSIAKLHQILTLDTSEATERFLFLQDREWKGFQKTMRVYAVL